MLLKLLEMTRISSQFHFTIGPHTGLITFSEAEVYNVTVRILFCTIENFGKV